MNAFVGDMLSSTAAERVGWALVHFLWQGAAVALALAAVLQLLRRRSAQARWLAACAALGLMAALPVLTAFLVTPEGPGAPPPVAAAPAGRPAVPPAVALLPAAPPVAPPAAPVPVAAEAPARSPSTGWAQRTKSLLQPLLPWVVLAWAVGVALMSAWHLGGWWQLRRTRRLGTQAVGGGLGATFRALARELRISRPVRLLESARAAVPMVIGWLRPVVLLPAAAMSGLTPGQLQAVLAHELAHVRRHDCLVRTVQAVIEALLFYHPAVWWVSARVRQESEQCCDDLAVAVCGDRHGYARALARVAELGRAGPRLAAAAGGGKLLPRIRRILGAGEAREGASSSRWLAGMLAVGVVAALAAAPLLGAATAREQGKAVGATGRPATLPSGATVELVGVSYHPSEGRPWWQPDGTPMESAPYAQFNAGGFVSPTPNREFAYIVHPADANVSCGITGSSGNIVGRPLDHTGARLAGLRAKAAHLAAVPPGCTITFNVAAGEWKTLATTRGNGMAGQGSTWGGAAFGGATERDGGCSISLSYDLAGHAVRLVAVTADGREHTTDRWSSASGGQAMLAEATFEGIRLEDVREFGLQARPYQRVEFRNVSLEPGRRTNVEVIVEGDKAPADPEALMEQYHEEIKAAAEAYARDHGGEWPKTTDDVLSYIPDKELAETLRPALEWGRVEVSKTVLKQRLYGLSHGLRLYREKHGVYPPDLKALEDWPGRGSRSALGEDGLASYNVGEQQVQYVIPKSDDPYEVLLYHWPPMLGEASVLYQNEHLTMLPVRQDGSLINHLTGQLVRGTDGDDKEAEKARAAVINAVAAYLRDHVDALPATARDLTPYVAGAQALRKTNDAEVRAWARARKEANKYERSQRLSRLRVVLRAYRQEHAGSYPETIDQEFAQRYLGSADAISWPGFQLVYAPPRTASVEEVIAYWWPLVDGGTRLLFADGQTRWVEATDNDQIVNPRTGAVIRPTQSAQPEGATTAEPHAAGPDTALGVAQRFLELLCSGKDDEELIGLTEPGTIRDSGAFLTPMRQELDLSKAAITGFWIAEEDACAVTSAFPTRRGDRTVAWGLGLRRNGNQWLVCDLDALPTEQRREQFVQRFRDANPSARQVLPMQQAAAGGKAPADGEEAQADAEALMREHHAEIKAAAEAYARDHAGEWPRTTEDLLSYIEDKELAEKLRPALGRAQIEARKAVLRQRLHGLGLALAMHRRRPDGYPKALKELEELGYLGEGNPLASFSVGEQKVQYVIPQSDDPYEALLYHWPPFHGEASLLYQNLHVDWVPVTEQGALINPLTGRIIRGAEDPGEDSLRRRVTVIRAIADFMQDHGDDVPEQLADLAPYVPNADVLGRLTGGQTRMRQWAQARREANKHARSQRLSQLWSALRAYRREHGDTPPDRVDQDFVDGYLDDPLALTWPGFQLVYCGPDSDVVAYWWPSVDGGTRLLFADGGTHWVELDEDGRLTNPRTGAVIRPPETRPAEAAFGPVVERVLSDAPGKEQFIDFDSGQLFASPANMPATGAAVKAWKQLRGIDASVDIAPGPPHRAWVNKERNLFHKALPAERWGRITPEQVRGLLREPNAGLHARVDPGQEPKEICAFVTPEGGMGILQIVGFTVDPPGVQIRYRMVRTAEPEAKADEPAWGEAVAGVQDRPRPEIWKTYPALKERVDAGLAGLPGWLKTLEPESFAQNHPGTAKLAESRDLDQRVRAIQAIEALRDVSGLPILVAAIRSAEPEERRQAAYHLAKWVYDEYHKAVRTPPASLEPLLPVFIETLVGAGDEPNVRAYCFQAIGSLAGPEWLPLVRDLSASRHPAVTHWSAWAVEQLTQRPKADAPWGEAVEGVQAGGQSGEPAFGAAIVRPAREFVEAALKGDEEVRKLYPGVPDANMKTQTEPFREIARLNPDWRFKPATVLFDSRAALVIDEQEVVADRRDDERGRICFTLRAEDGRWQIADIDLEDAEGVEGEIERFRARHPDAELWRPDADQEAAELTFGAVMERVVQDRQFVDLDSGQVLETSQDDPGPEMERILARGREIGADALLFLGSGVRERRWCMVNVGAAVMPVRRQGDPWSELTADDLAAMGPKFPPGTSLIQVLGELPNTMAIRTREGAVGVLQIVGFTEDPPGVKIRYKMVQRAGPSATAATAPTPDERGSEPRPDGESPTRMPLEEAANLLIGAHAEMGRRNAQGEYFLAMAVRPGDPKTRQSARFWVFSYAPGTRPELIASPRSLPGVYFTIHFMSVNGHYPSEYIDEKGDIVSMRIEDGMLMYSGDPWLIAWGSTFARCELTDDLGNSMRFMLSPEPAPKADEPASGEAVEGVQVGGPSGKLSFGPVIERVVTREGEVTFVFIDFDTGTLLPPPSELKLTEGAARPNVTTLAWPQELRDWVRHNGADAVLEVHPGEIGLKALGMRRATAPGGRPAKYSPPLLLSAEEAADAMTATPSSLRNSFSAFAFVVERPLSGYGFPFDTREGGVGVLEVNADKAPDAPLVIRYKMVQQAAQGPPEDGLKAPEPEAARVEGSPNRATSVEPPWNRSPEGIHVRMWPHKTLWRPDEIPTLRADLNNLSGRAFLIPANQQGCELEVDGRWYRWAAAERGNVERRRIVPGAHLDDVLFVLDGSWASTPGGTAPRLPEGKHSLRIAFICDPVAGRPPVRAESLAVEIEIRTPAPPLPARADPERFAAEMSLAEKAADADSRVAHLRNALRFRPDDPANIALEYQMASVIHGSIVHPRYQGGKQDEARAILEGILTRYHHMDYYTPYGAHSARSPEALVPYAALLEANWFGNAAESARLYRFVLLKLRETFDRRRQDWLNKPKPTFHPMEDKWDWEGSVRAWQERQENAAAGVVLTAVESDLAASAIRGCLERVAPERAPEALGRLIAGFPERETERALRRIVTWLPGTAAAQSAAQYIDESGLAPRGALTNPRTGAVIRPAETRPAAAATFGPVIERVVNDDNAGADMMIDLDTGALHSPPVDVGGSEEEQLAWLRASGIDAIAECAASVRGLGGYDMLVVPVPNASWAGSADEVPGLRELWERRGTEEPATRPARRRPVLMSAKGELPATFVFKTREGGMGILQIVGFAEDPEGVKIRYKMVQQEPRDDDAAQLATSPPAPAERLVQALRAGDQGAVDAILESHRSFGHEGLSIRYEDFQDGNLVRPLLRYVKDGTGTYDLTAATARLAVGMAGEWARLTLKDGQAVCREGDERLPWKLTAAEAECQINPSRLGQAAKEGRCTLKDFEFRWGESTITGASAALDAGTETYAISGPVATRGDPDPALRLLVTAERATYARAARTLKLRGSVEARRGNFELAADDLAIGLSGVIATDGPFTLRGRDIRAWDSALEIELTTEGGEADFSQQTLAVSRGATMVLRNLPEEVLAELSGLDASEVTGAELVLRCAGPAAYNQKAGVGGLADFRLSIGGKRIIKGDRLQVSRVREGEGYLRIKATGSVEVRRQGVTVRGDSIEVLCRRDGVAFVDDGTEASVSEHPPGPAETIAPGEAPETPKVVADRLTLGQVHVGSIAEASVRVHLKADYVPDMRPGVEAPPFVHMQEATVGTYERGPRTGKAHCDVLLSLSTEREGDYAGHVRIAVGDEAAEVPVSITVLPQRPGLTKVLIVSTPFQKTSTDDATHFRPLLDLVKASDMDVSYARDLPQEALSDFDVILLAERALLSVEDPQPLWAFVEGGGRLVLAANYFYRGTVDKANAILAGHGLRMDDVEPGWTDNHYRTIEATGPGKIVTDPLTRGVERVTFFRPSPIRVTDSEKAKILVVTPYYGGEGFVALARDTGEIVVLGQSLWWSWLGRGEGNAQLMRNILTQEIGGE